MNRMIITLKRTNVHTARLFEVFVRMILSLLLMVLIGGMARGVYVLLRRVLDPASGLDDLLQGSIVDALAILAVVEVYRTTRAYFAVGRVRVTYALDTVLVVLLTEVMVFWFGGAAPTRIIMIALLILVLVVARILTIRFSPGARRPSASP